MKDGVELPRERYNLSFDEYGVCDQELSYAPVDEKEPLMLSRSSVLVHVGNSTPIDVIFGRVGSIRSEDSTIAAGSTSSIRGLKAGETTIFYQDAEDPNHVIEVHVTVIGEGKENWGFYRIVPVYEEYVSYTNGGEGSYVGL